jgi:hypothetical protein
VGAQDADLARHLDRDIGRKIAGDTALESTFAVAREGIKRLLIQQRDNKGKLYALHAPEMNASQGRHPSLNRMLVLDLAWCEYIVRGENIIALGTAGQPR